MNVDWQHLLTALFFILALCILSVTVLSFCSCLAPSTPSPPADSGCVVYQLASDAGSEGWFAK